MVVRGIRGAITVDEDKPEEIKARTQELLTALVSENNIDVEDIASALFSVSPDIKSAFPAEAARSMGWNMVPLFCFQEIEVEGAMPGCIRCLLHVNTLKKQDEIRHIYLREAVKLRQDLVNSRYE